MGRYSIGARLERGQDFRTEEADVLLGERVRQRAELEEPDEDADAQLARLRADLANDVVGVAHDRHAFLLAEIEVELVERHVLGLLDPRRTWGRGLPHEGQGAAMVTQRLLPEEVEM